MINNPAFREEAVEDTFKDLSVVLEETEEGGYVGYIENMTYIASEGPTYGQCLLNLLDEYKKYQQYLGRV